MSTFGYIMAAYLIGSLSPAWLIVKWKTGEDLRRTGTGNLGTRNAGRHVGLLAVVVLILDFAKGYLVVWWGQTAWGIPVALLGALAVTVGHIFSLFLRFNGGKGLATGAGVITAISPVAFLIVSACGLITLMVTRKVYGAAFSLLVITVPVLWAYLPGPERWWFPVVFALIGLYSHRSHLKTSWRELR